MRQKAEITCEECAKLIRKSPQYVRWGLQENRLPFGSAVQKPNGRWSYNIVKSRVLEYLDKNEKSEQQIIDLLNLIYAKLGGNTDENK